MPYKVYGASYKWSLRYSVPERRNLFARNSEAIPNSVIEFVERNIEMNLSPEATEAVQSELKRFAADLNLSEDQKTQLKTALESAREKLDEVRKSHPDITKADVIAKLRQARSPLRERVTAFLTPEQLTKWDAEVAKAKAFLGYSA